MALGIDFPLLDGIAPSWADATIRVGPNGAPLVEMKDIASIDTGTTLDVATVRGASGGRPRRYTTGEVSHTASITLYRHGYQTLIRNLMPFATLRGNQLAVGLVIFEISVMHTPPGSLEIFEYRIKGCRLGGRTANTAEGTEAQQVEVPLHTLQIVDIIDGNEVVLL